MIDVTGRGKITEVGLSITKMLHHVGPSAIDKRLSVPETTILLEDWLLCKDDISEVNHLLSSHGRGTSMISKF
jgi:hypothetical protein